MKDWRVHFLWAIVTVVAAGLSARVASQREAAIPPPQHETTTASAATAAGTSRKESGPAISVPATEDWTPVPIPDSQQQIADQIRSILQKCENWDRFHDVFDRLTDRALKLILAKEALASEEVYKVNWGLNILVGMKCRDATRALAEFLKNHPDHEAAVNAATWLGALRDPESLGALNDALHSGREEVRDASTRSLLMLGYSKPAEQLMATLAQQFESDDGSVRREAVDRMSDLGQVGATPFLLRALRDSNGDVRMSAIQAFSSLDHPEYLPYLEPLVQDPNPRVARQAKALVEELKGEQK